MIRAQYEGRWQPQAMQQAMKTSTLAALLQAGMRDADQALIADADYLRLFGLHKATSSRTELYIVVTPHVVKPGEIVSPGIASPPVATPRRP